MVTLFAGPPNVGLAAILATDLIDYGKRKYGPRLAMQPGRLLSVAMFGFDAAFWRLCPGYLKSRASFSAKSLTYSGAETTPRAGQRPWRFTNDHAADQDQCRRTY